MGHFHDCLQIAVKLKKWPVYRSDFEIAKKICWAYLKQRSEWTLIKNLSAYLISFANHVFRKTFSLCVRMKDQVVTCSKENLGGIELGKICKFICRTPCSTHFYFLTSTSRFNNSRYYIQGFHPPLMTMMKLLI